MTIRDWILKLIPNIDGPTLHAVTEGFRADDIHTLGNMLECYKSGVLEITDVKGYMAQGKLPKLKQAKIIKEFNSITR